MLLKKNGHPNISQVIREMVKAEAADPATRRRDALRQAVARHHPDRRRPADLLQGLLHRQRFPCRDADAAARLRPLQGRQAERRSLHRIRAGRRLLGQGPAGQCRLRQFRHDPHRLLHRAPDRLRGLQEGRDHLPRGVHLDHLGEGLRLPRHQRRQGQEVAVSRPRTARPTRAGSSTPGAPKFRDPRTRLAIGLAFDFEWSNRNLFFDSYTRD